MKIFFKIIMLIYLLWLLFTKFLSLFLELPAELLLLLIPKGINEIFTNTTITLNEIDIMIININSLLKNKK